MHRNQCFQSSLRLHNDAVYGVARLLTWCEQPRPYPHQIPQEMVARSTTLSSPFLYYYEGWYSFCRPTAGSRPSRPKHCRWGTVARAQSHQPQRVWLAGVRHGWTRTPVYCVTYVCKRMKPAHLTTRPWQLVRQLKIIYYFAKIKWKFFKRHQEYIFSLYSTHQMHWLVIYLAHQLTVRNLAHNCYTSRNVDEYADRK